eukprot:1854117-Amphidinium_carterae.1
MQVFLFHGTSPNGAAGIAREDNGASSSATLPFAVALRYFHFLGFMFACAAPAGNSYDVARKR